VSLADELDSLFNDCWPAFSSHSSWLKARELLYGGLTCMGRHTVTGMLSASGNQFKDWSGAYRLFSQKRIDIEKVYEIIRKNIVRENEALPFIVGHMDDTIIKKTGKKIPGTAWRRDPLGPPFHTNFIWGQRFIQISLALPQEGSIGQSRAIPVDFHHCPTAVRPKYKATQEQLAEYKDEKKASKLSRQGINRIIELRHQLNESGAKDKELVLSVDGSYTNTEVLKKLPDGVTLVGRIRKDTKIYSLPENQPGVGRKKVYGEQLPTPEQIRVSDDFPWQKVKAWACGKLHEFSLKVVKDVRWRSAGENHDLTLVVIKPLGYRLTKDSKILYRDPAYLLVTKTDLALENILQSYLWRWEIEVNFREEKTLLGCGEAQVRNKESAATLPAFTAAMYGLLHLANHKSLKKGEQEMLPRAKWYARKETNRITTGDLLNNLRAQLWAKATEIDFSDFIDKEINTRSRRNSICDPKMGAFYMRN
jgi:hypothetical protein